MDAAIQEIISSDGASLYSMGLGGGQAAGPTGPMGAGLANIGGKFGFGANGSVGANGTAIVLILVTVGLVWFYMANRGMMR